MQYYYGRSMMDSGFGGWGIFMMVFWVIFIIIVGFVVVHMLSHHYGDTHRKVDHLDIIKERYAKGDITKEQFEQLKKDLK